MAQPAPNDSEKPAEGKFGRALAPASFRAVERLLLLTIAAMTMVAAGVEIFRVISERSVNLADILLMFLYAEVIGMVAVFYGGQQSPFIYPIFIAITAVARLIVLQGKEMAPVNIVFEAGAILLLSIAALIITRANRP
jgi:protein PsiE